ncbi:MAG: S9 family peptidase [Deinococcota bacterium]
MATPLPIENLASLPKFAMATVSHGGDKLAFYWDKTGRFELYVMDLLSRDIQQITNGQAPKGLSAGFVWTRDDKHIIFGKDNDGDELNNLYMLELATGEVTQLSDDQHQQYPGDVHPDNTFMAVMSNKDGQMNIYRYTFADGSWQQLTNFDAPSYAECWSKDGRWLAFSSNESDNYKNMDGYIINADGSNLKKCFSCKDGSNDAIIDWHPDGVQVAVDSDQGDGNRAGILNLDTNEVHWLGETGCEEFAGEFSKNGRWLSCIRDQDATFMPILYDVETGIVRELNLPPGIAGGTQFALDDTKLLVRHGASNRRSELLLYDLETDSYDTLLEADYGGINPARFVEDEHIWYTSFDGQKVPALIHKPQDLSLATPCPAVVSVHGGPTSQFFRGFDMKTQFLVSCGYVVLSPNIRGSTGYGNTWRDANRYDWGGGDLEDVAAGAAYLKNLPYVDAERVAVMGGSFGGFMSFLISVKKPDLFKVAVPTVGITDLHKLYEDDTENFKYSLRKQMGDPEENYELWRDRSAIEFVDQLQAKMLIMHGVNDPRCPVTQSRIFRDKLLELGKTQGTAETDDFEYHEFEDEGHGSSGDIQGMIRSLKIIADFFERRL